MFDWLQSVYDFGYNAAYGAVSPAQEAKIMKDARDSVRRAGGTDEQAEAAAREVSNFLHDYWPARTPAETLWDDVTGDPMGMHRAIDAPDDAGNWSWFFVVAAALVVLFVVVVLFERR